MLIDLVATTIESVIFTTSLFNNFGIKSKKCFVFLIILWLFENLLFFHITTQSQYLSISILITNVLFLALYFKKIHFTYISYTLLLYGILLLSNTVALATVSFVFEISIVKIPTNHVYFISGIIISRIVFLLSAIFFHTFLNRNKEGTKIKEWWPLFVFIITLLLMSDTLLSSIILNEINIRMVYFLFVELFILIISTFIVYKKIQKQNQLNIEMSEIIAKREYQEKMHTIVNRTIDKINSDKHMMLYNLLNIKNMLQSNNLKQATIFINNEINKFLNYRFTSTSNNPLFDYELTIKINSLLSQGKNIKTIILINKYNCILDDNTLVSFIMNCIDTYNISKQIEFLFKEVDNNYIIFKISLTKPTCIDIEDIKIPHHCKVKKTLSSDSDLTVSISFLLNNQ